MTIQVSQREGVVLIQTVRPGIVTTIGLHPLEAKNLRDALNGMDLNGMPFLPSDVPQNLLVIDCAPYDPEHPGVWEP
jgi:hypothetical protein